MGYMKEKVAYLKGLAEGLGLDKEGKEGKIIAAMIDHDIYHGRNGRCYR